MKIIKRDGREVDFDSEKIKEAILKAFIDVDKELTDYAFEKAENISKHIQSLNEEGKNLTIEEIQNLVEDGLMRTKRKDVAKSYILFREERRKARENKSPLTKRIKEKINATNPLQQNANVDEKSFGGRAGEASNELFKQYALDNLISDMARRNHINNEVYIHDLSSYAIGNHNCLTLPIDKLLKEGFSLRQCDIRPANSIQSALQLIAVLFQVQSLEMFGGVAAGHLDWSMVPYVRKSFSKHFKDGVKYCEQKEDSLEISNELSFSDPIVKEYSKAYNYAMDMTIKEVNQATEAFFHNLNSLQSRSGN